MTKMKRKPRGLREGHDGSLACQHRDVSCCPTCAAAHEEIARLINQQLTGDQAVLDAIVRHAAALPGVTSVALLTLIAFVTLEALRAEWALGAWGPGFPAITLEAGGTLHADRTLRAMRTLRAGLARITL